MLIAGMLILADQMVKAIVEASMPDMTLLQSWPFVFGRGDHYPDDWRIVPPALALCAMGVGVLTIGYLIRQYGPAISGRPLAFDLAGTLILAGGLTHAVDHAIRGFVLNYFGLLTSRFLYLADGGDYMMYAGNVVLLSSIVRFAVGCANGVRNGILESPLQTGAR